ncbi:heat shock protein 70 family [Lipomyces japonicus]|uniref:heat shock protein 70 family n=1 Tax=Lipomyces japonicus TaxID=56871 RepID=UPI0034CDCDE3
MSDTPASIESNGAEEFGSAFIGISFGNANSSIAFTKDGKVEVIADQDGYRSIPSALSYLGGDEYHGFQAKAQLIRNSKNTVVNFRDFIGKKYSEIDPTNSHVSAHPIEKDGVVGFNLAVSNQEGAEPEFVSVAEITKRHFARLKEAAAEFLGKPIEGAVIAVPTDFTSAQRQALEEIAQSAGINILQTIHEPVAALLAYDAATAGAFTTDRIVVVADFGSTRSDVAVVAVRGGLYTVLATAHNYELGGDALDKTLVDHFAKEFEKKYNADPRTESERSLAKLLAEAEVTKKTLSNTNTATISIDSLAAGYDFHSTINRLRFELLARKVFDNVSTFVEDVVKKAGLDVLDVDEVVLVGGSSHTPKIAARIESLFAETTVIRSPASSANALNPAELIARGTATQASLISGFEKKDIEESIQPVITNAPHISKPIGIVNAEGKFVTILENYTTVPIRASKVFQVATGGDFAVDVFEGEEHIVTRKIEKTKAERSEQEDEDDDEEDDFSDEDEEEREKVVKPVTKIAEAAITSVNDGAKVEVILNISADLKLGVVVREIGGQTVRGSIEGNTVA